MTDTTSRAAAIAAMNALVTSHKKRIAEKLRAVSAEIKAEEDLYTGMGFPAQIAQTFQNCTHLADQLDPLAPVEGA